MKKTRLRLLEVIKTSRPFLWIITGFAFAAGYLLSAKGIGLEFFISTLYFLIPYNLLLYGINDIFDLKSDIKNPRKVSVENSPAGKQKYRYLLDWIILLNLPFVVYLLIIGDIKSKIIFATLIFLVIAYSYKGLRFKEIPFIDSITSSLHFVGPFILGLSLSNSINFYWPIIISFFFWGIASHTFKAIQDIISDRASDINSIAVSLGAKGAMYLSFFLYCLSSLIILIAYWPLGIIPALLIGVYPLNISFFLKYKSDAQSNKFIRGWKNFLWLNLSTFFWLSLYIFLIIDPLGFGTINVFMLGEILIFIFILQFLLIIYNFWGLKKPKLNFKLAEWPKITILIHAYNQAQHISSTLLAALGQHYPNFEIIFTDLNSADNTLKIVENYQDPKLKIVTIDKKKSHWSQNAWANQQMLEQAKSDIVVILSADTVMMPNTLTAIAGLITDQKLDVISLLPADQNSTLSQRFILSQNRFFLLGTYPAAYLNNKRRDFALATRSIIAFHKTRTQIFNNFESAKKSLLENLDFMVNAKKYRLKTAFYLASDLATNHDNASLKSIFLQNYQNYYPILKFNMPLTVNIVIGGFLVFSLPLFLLIDQIIRFDITNIIILSTVLLIGLINRILIAIQGKQSLLSTLFYPITIPLTLILIFISMLNYELLKPRWHERTEVHTI